MSASGAAPTPRRRAALIMIAAGLVVTLVLAIGVVWFLMDGRNSAAAGTLDGLDDAGSAGSWHAVEPFTVGSEELVAGAATAFTIDRADAALPADTTSVLLQLELVPGAEAGGIVVGGERDSPTVSFSANAPVTTSQLVLLDSEGTVTLTADQSVAVTLTLFAYLQVAEKNEPTVGPGGSVAIAPRPVIDTNTGLGAALAALDTPITLSPQGLGAVPTEGVAAVWLQVALLGVDARLSLPTTGDDESAPTVLQSTGAFANALVFVPLDERGLFQWRFSGTVDQVRASVTGWVAGQGRSLDAATIAGGLVPVAAANLDTANLDAASLTPTLPTGVDSAAVGSALYSVQVTTPTPGTVSADAGDSRADDRRETTLPVRGAASTLVIAGPGGTISLPKGAIADSLTLLGYFPTAVEAAGSAPGVSITEPAADGSVNLGDAGGTFVIHGTITQADAGVQLVEVRLGNRSIGSARMDATVSPPRWSIETSATPGDHEVSVTVTDWAGQTGQAEVAFTVEVPAESAAIANNRTVVLDAKSLAVASDLTASSISFSGLSPAVVGEFLVAGVSAATPDGIMREVTAVELVDGLVVVSTRPASFSDIVLQVNHRVVDQALLPEESEQTPDSTDTASAAPASTGPVILPASYSAAAPTAHQAVAVQTGSDQTAADLAETKRVGVVDLSATVSVTTEPEVSVEYESKSQDVKMNITASAEGADASFSAGDTELSVPAPEASATPTPTPSSTAAPDPNKPTFSGEASLELGVAFELVTYATLTIEIAPVWEWRKDVRTVLADFESSVKQQQTQTIEVSSYGEIAVKYGSGKKQRRVGQLGTPLQVTAGALPNVSLGRLLGVIPTPVPIPWVLTFDLSAEFDWSLSLTGTTTFTAVERITREFGVRLENGKLRSFNDTITETAPTVWKSELEVALGATLALRVDAMIYDMAGVYFGIDITPALTVGSTVERTTGEEASVLFATKFDIVVEGIVGVKLEVFDKNLLNWEAEPRELYKKVFWDEEYTLDELAFAVTGDEAFAPETATDPDTATGTGNRALLVVVDLSGSMAGERIEKAQDALTQLVMSQPLGSEMGIWTYGGSCEQSGDYAIEVAPVMGTGDLVTEIAGFEAAGGTPTAEALLAATKHLKEDGNTGATVVLVSDGESGCGDPCEAASQIRAQGFDLQVQSVGFQTSAAGETELECIAEKTDGTYTSVEDVDALADKLAELGRASIDLTVAAGDTILANQAQNIDVTVTNPSGRDAADITVALTFPSGDLVPLVSPSPQLLFGNLPPGASSTQSVQLYSTVQDAVGSTDYRVIAWGAEVDAVIVEGSYETLSERTEPIAPGPILADAAASDYPAALVGDGLASGDTGCEAGTDSGTDAKTGGYAVALADTTEPVVLACAGTSGNNLLGSEAPTGADNQLERLAAEPAVSEVIVSVGAADVGLDALLALCASSGCALDDPMVRTVIGKAQELDLGPVYRSVWATVNTEQALEARGGAHAPVIVTAYPQLFANDRALDCTTEWGRSEAQVGHTVIAYLNAALETAALRVAADGYEVYFAAGPEDAMQPNHTLCDDDSFVTTTDDGRLVPSADGLAAAGDALLLWSQNRPRTAPTESALASAPTYAVPAPGLVKSVGHAVSGLANPTKSVDLTATGPAVNVAPGQQVRVTGSGFLPGSPVVVTLSGDPSILGTTTADADGRADLTAIVPQHTALGTATVRMNGAQMSGASPNGAASGVELELVRELRIGALVPIWIVATVFGGLLLLLAAIGLALLARRLARSAPRRPALSKPAAGPRT